MAPSQVLLIHDQLLTVLTCMFFYTCFVEFKVGLSQLIIYAFEIGYYAQAYYALAVTPIPDNSHNTFKNQGSKSTL